MVFPDGLFLFGIISLTMFYVYILQSLKDHSFYIGQTKDLEQRL
ncbi:MAG: hypothetical protein D6714_13850, partial [Bacteroidetes bacterium]